MQSIRQRLVHTSVLALAAFALACGSDAPSAPDDGRTIQNSQGTQPAGAVGLSVIPGALALRVGDTGTLTAALVDANNVVVAVPTGALPWTSSTSSVVTVSDAGVVTAVGVGDATISVTAGGFSGTARVNVR